MALKYWIYILWSNTLRRYYIGSTGDIEKRLREHNRGKSTFTEKGVPWNLVYKESRRTKKEAWNREMEIKRYKGGLQFKRLIELTKMGRVA